MCDCDCELPKATRWQQIRDETALQLGRDAMELRLVPFLTKLVGPVNASRLLAGVCGCPCDACTEYCEQGALGVDSCDGVEREPSTCRCPCYGCKHHCGAHEEPGLCTRPGHACCQPGAGPCNGLPNLGAHDTTEEEKNGRHGILAAVRRRWRDRPWAQSWWF